MSELKMWSIEHLMVNYVKFNFANERVTYNTIIIWSKHAGIVC